MKRLALYLCLTPLLFLSACGSSSQTPQQEIKQQGQEVISAIMKKDPATVCKHLTAKTQQLIAKGSKVSCVTYVRKIIALARLDAAGRQELQTFPIKVVSVNGNRGTIRLGKNDGAETVPVVKVGDKWQMDLSAAVDTSDNTSKTAASNAAAQSSVRTALDAAAAYYTERESFEGLTAGKLNGLESSLTGMSSLSQAAAIPGASADSQAVLVTNIGTTSVSVGKAPSKHTVVLCAVSKATKWYCAQDTDGAITYSSGTGALTDADLQAPITATQWQ